MTLLITSLAVLLAVTVFRVMHPPKKSPAAGVEASGVGGSDASAGDGGPLPE